MEKPISRELWWFSRLSALFALSCIPLLVSGYGSDGDAWRIAYTADRLWNAGEYTPSRPPGYPLHELVMAPLVAFGGSILTNTATLAATLVLIAAWKRFTDAHALNSRILLATLPFAPGLWENAASTMDYNWSLLFLLLAFMLSLQRAPVAAASLLTLAVGFRPANIVALVPLAVPFLLSDDHLRGTARFVLSSVIFSCAVFIPVALSQGVSEYIETLVQQTRVFPSTTLERFAFFAYRSVYAVGPIAVGVAIVLLFKGRKKLWERLRHKRPLMLTSLVFVLCYVCFFLLFPLEREYLLPALPFLLILIDAVASRRELIVFCLSLVSFSLVNPDVVRHEGVRGRPGFNLRVGSYIEELQARYQLAERRKQLSDLSVSGRCIIMAGSSQSMWFENEAFALDCLKPLSGIVDPTVHYRKNPDAHVVDALDISQIREAFAGGYRVYCFAPAAEYLEWLLGVSLTELGVTIVPP